jgi:hypothetical protein
VAGPTHRRWLDRAADLSAQIDSPTQRLNLAGDRAAALLMLGEEEALDVVADLLNGLEAEYGLETAIAFDPTRPEV